MSDQGAGSDASGAPAPAQTVSRRAALRVLGAVPIAGAIGALPALAQQVQPRHGHATPNQPTAPPKPASAPAKPKFFTARELRTVRVLADDVLPADARSGSATDAGVPEFMDFNLSVEETSERTRTQFRGGLRWLDTESKRRHGVAYAAARPAQRHAILDDIAFADKAPPALRHGAAFFAAFRDMVASGFWSSAMGWKDLQYQGHTFVPVWNGCPAPALTKLGVTGREMETRVPLQKVE